MVKKMKPVQTKDDRNIYLETIDTNRYAVYPTIESSNVVVDATDLMKTKIIELQNVTDQNTIAVEEQIPENQLEKSDNSVQMNINDEKNELKLSMNDLSCSLCNTKFSTKKMLTVHVRSLHTSKCLCYPCPCCSHVFANLWSVYRHLYKGHKKTLQQVCKLKSLVQKKAFYREAVMKDIKNVHATKMSPLKNVMENSDKTQEPISHIESDTKFYGRPEGRLRKASLITYLDYQPPITTCDKTTIRQQQFEQCDTLSTSSSSTRCETKDVNLVNNTIMKSSINEHIPKINSEDTSSSEMCMSTCIQDVSSLNQEERNRLGNKNNHLLERNSVDNNNDFDIILPKKSDNSKLLSPTENQFVPNENLKSLDIVSTDTNKVSFAAFKMKDKKNKVSSLYNEKQLIDSKERDKIELKEDNSKLRSSRSTRLNKKNSKNWKWKNWTLLKDKIAIMADYRKLRCLLCQQKFSSTPNLRRHIAMHIGWYRYCCKLCNFKCFVKCDCDAHCSKVHSMQNSRTVLAEIVLEKSQDEYTYKGNLKSPGMYTIVYIDTNKGSFAALKIKDKKKKTSFYNGKQLIDLKEREIGVDEDNSKLQSSRSTRLNQRNSKNRKWKNWTLLENKIAIIADYRKLRCFLCQHKFSSIFNLRRHIVMHINWYDYSRKLCNFKCFVKCDCLAHCSKVHNMQNSSTFSAQMVLEISQDECTYEEDSADLKITVTDSKTKSDNPDMDVDMVNVTASSCQSETHVNSDSIYFDSHVILQNELMAANKQAVKLCGCAKCQNIDAGDSDKTVKIRDLSTECTMDCKKLDDKLKRMVMEVVLGSTDTSLIKVQTDFDKPVLETSDSTGRLVEVNNDNINNAATIDESKETFYPILSTAKRQRPIRNRVKLLNKDFIYEFI